MEMNACQPIPFQAQLTDLFRDRFFPGFSLVCLLYGLRSFGPLFSSSSAPRCLVILAGSSLGSTAARERANVNDGPSRLGAGTSIRGGSKYLASRDAFVTYGGIGAIAEHVTRTALSRLLRERQPSSPEVLFEQHSGCNTS